MWDLLSFIAGAYLYDVVWRPAIAAKQARRVADYLGKPVLNVGAGTPGSSFRVFVLGPTLWGDVNMDLASREPYCGPHVVCHGDVLNIPYADKTFGAAIAAHVIEHVDDPARALQELHRVADYVFVIVPRWWCPHTWLHPGHKWFVGEQGARALWQ